MRCHWFVIGAILSLPCASAAQTPAGDSAASRLTPGAMVRIRPKPCESARSCEWTEGRLTSLAGLEQWEAWHEEQKAAAKGKICMDTSGSPSAPGPGANGPCPRLVNQAVTT